MGNYLRLEPSKMVPDCHDSGKNKIPAENEVQDMRENHNHDSDAECDDANNQTRADENKPEPK